MTQEEEVYYERYFDLFSTDGWKQFIEELEEIIDNYTIDEIKDEKHLNTVKGQLQILYRVTGFETSIRNSYDYASEGNNA